MKNEARAVLSKKVRELREKSGLTQEKLASLADVDYKYLQKIEGKNPPAVRIDTIEKLAKALRVPYSDLLESKSRSRPPLSRKKS